MPFIKKRHGETDKPVPQTKSNRSGMPKLAVSEKRACKVLGQTRTAQRHELVLVSDEKQLTEDILVLATKYGRYGYRKITFLLNDHYGWRVNHKRVERI